MKKKSKLTFTFLIFVSVISIQTVSARFGINIPKIPKIKKDKPQPESSNVSGASNDQKLPESSSQTGKNDSLGIIYFSNQPFTTGTEGSKTSFNSNEFIYGRLVLNGGTVRDVLNPSPMTTKFKINQIPFKIYWKDSSGQKHYPDFLADNAVVSAADLDKSYWDFDVFPQPEKAKTVVFTDRNFNNGYESTDSVYLFLKNDQTKEGTYPLGVEISTAGADFRGNPIPASQRKSVEGEISFTFRGADYATIKANLNALTKNFAANANRNQAANQELPKEWSQPSNRILPILSEAQMSQMYLNHSKEGSGLKVIKFYATAPGQTSWSVEKNDLGIPLYRFSNQTYWVFIKNTAANQCFFDDFGLRQNYSGGGTYGQTFLDFDEGSKKSFNCDKVK